VSLVVQKYGGSSVADSQKILNVAKRIIETKKKGNKVVVVVSAMGDTTDELLKLASEITDSPPERELDMLLSTGEQVSIALLSMAIKELGEQVISFTASQAGIFTDQKHTKAKILNINTDKIKRELDRDKIVIVAGFQGVTEDYEITTLGRGGSDTTAVALAAALEANLCEIYTDVDGVYTADPRLVKEAKKLSLISYDEMLELASLGAKVLHPRAVECAKNNGVPLVVRSTFNDNAGTLLKEVVNMERIRPVSGIAHDINVAKITLYDVPDRPGVAAEIFKALAKEGINVDIIVQSANRAEFNDISFTVSHDELNKALTIVKEVAKKLGSKRVEYNSRVAKVSIV
jgi:aspartate kinase